MSDNPLDALDELEKQKPRPRPSSKGDNMGELLQAVQPAGDVTEVTKRGKYAKHGQYLQVTFRLPPEYMDAIRDIAKQEHISQASLKRWLVGIGLQEYRKGRRPKVKEVVHAAIEIPAVEDDE